jgi:hypothetical protein
MGAALSGQRFWEEVESPKLRRMARNRNSPFPSYVAVPDTGRQRFCCEMRLPARCPSVNSARGPSYNVRVKF